MATKKITDLTNVTSVQDSDLLIVETSDGTRSVNRSGLLGGAVVHPYNLLDNSDFTNPINQRGQTSFTTTWAKSIDRWYIASTNSENVVVNIVDNGITSTSQFTMQQRFIKGILDSNKKYTIAVYYTDGTISVYTNGSMNFNGENFDYISLAIAAGKTAKHVALYEGEYTADTMPTYIPKGYAVELMECQRYYYKTNFVMRLFSYGDQNGTCSGNVYFPVRMHSVPTVTATVSKLIVDANTDATSSVQRIDYENCNDWTMISAVTLNTNYSNKNMRMYIDVIEAKAEL